VPHSSGSASAGTPDGASDHYVSEALYCTDPEDNGIEIYTDRPRAEWPRASDGTIRIGTAPARSRGRRRPVGRKRGRPAGTTVGHVHLEVSSIDATREFYVETLGLTVQTEAQSALFLAAGDYHHHLGTNVERPVATGGRSRTRVVRVRRPDDETLATVRRRLDDADVAVADRTGGLELTDPDGISIRIRAA